MMELNLQMAMPQNADQVANMHEQIIGRLKDLEDRVYIKIDKDTVEYVPVWDLILNCNFNSLLDKQMLTELIVCLLDNWVFKSLTELYKFIFIDVDFFSGYFDNCSD